MQASEKPPTAADPHDHVSAGGRRRVASWRAAPMLFAGVVLALYAIRLADVPLIKVDEWWGTEASWTIWREGRFALPGLALQLNEARRTFFHPPGFYLLNAPVLGLLGVSSWSIRVLSTICVLASLLILYRLNRDLILRCAGSGRDDLALLGVAVVAFNPMTFAVARHTRPESLIVLLASAVVYLLRPLLFEDGETCSRRSASSRALLGGLLSGYAVFSHYWAYVLPALVGLALLRRGRIRLLALYGIGVVLFAAVTGGWIAAGYEDFAAETRWLRGGEIGGPPWRFVQRRVQQMISLLGMPQMRPVWLLEVVACTVLALSRPSQTRRRIFVAFLLLHGFFFAFPRQNRLYTVGLVYFWGAAMPLALALGPRAVSWRLPVFRAQTTAALRRLLCGALVALEVAGLGFWIHRDWTASYTDTLAPLKQAMDAVDPARTGAVVGASPYYVAFHQRSYLPRVNPSLWRLPEPLPEEDAAAAREIVRAWRARGVRFVLLSTLVPGESRLSRELPRALDERLTAHIRSTGRLLATSRTYFYGEIEHQYRWTTIELYELSPAPEEGRQSEERSPPGPHR